MNTKALYLWIAVVLTSLAALALLLPVLGMVFLGLLTLVLPLLLVLTPVLVLLPVIILVSLARDASSNPESGPALRAPATSTGL